MTAKGDYEPEREVGYEVRLLKDLRAAVRSIDSKVADILDELRESLPGKPGYDNSWHLRDLDDED